MGDLEGIIGQLAQGVNDLAEAFAQLSQVNEAQTQAIAELKASHQQVMQQMAVIDSELKNSAATDPGMAPAAPAAAASMPI